MDINLFCDVANHHINEWKLPAMGWKWGFNNRKRALGLCDYREKKLFFSTDFVLINPPEIMIDVIKHEIAHALAGPFARHGYIWKQKAIEVGARPRSCQANAISVEGKYFVECVPCNVKYYYHRRPKYDIRICRKCRSRLVIKENNSVSSKTRFISSILDGV